MRLPRTPPIVSMQSAKHSPADGRVEPPKKSSMAQSTAATGNLDRCADGALRNAVWSDGKADEFDGRRYDNSSVSRPASRIISLTKERKNALSRPIFQISPRDSSESRSQCSPEPLIKSIFFDSRTSLKMVWEKLPTPMPNPGSPILTNESNLARWARGSIASGFAVPQKQPHFCTAVNRRSVPIPDSCNEINRASSRAPRWR
jgi:hypothetical protein